MKNKTFKKLIASTATAAMMMSVAILPADAAKLTGETFDGMINAAVDQTPSLTFTATESVADGGKIYVDIPDEFTGGIAADISSTSGIATATAMDCDTSIANVCVYTLTGQTIAAAEEVTVAFTDLDADMLEGGGEGRYWFGVYTTDADDVVIDDGGAPLDVDNQVSVEALVVEALIMTINDTTLNLVVDPSVNGGQDNDEQTVLSIKSNAYGGFTIQAALEDSANEPDQLLGNTHNQALTSAPDSNTENYLRFSTTEGGTDFDAGTTVADTPYAGTTTAYTSEAAGGALSNGDTVTVTHDLNVDYTTAADVYSGTITYTAVPTF